MNQLWKTILTFLGVAAVLVGWGITWALIIIAVGVGILLRGLLRKG